jgi:negative regulator of flagellin synthesis FlgM
MVQKLEKNRDVKKSDRRPEGKDTIELSDASKRIKEYAEIARTMESSNIDKVEAIKSKLASGTYKVSSKELAERILSEIKEQMSDGE